MERIARLICQQERISPTRLASLRGGQVNATYVLDDQFILRIAQDKTGGLRLAREADLLRRLAGEMPVPEVTSLGELEGASYQIQRRVPGQPLHRVWTALSLQEQDGITGQLAQHMQALHQHTFSKFGLWSAPNDHKKTWREHLVTRFQSSTGRLRQLPGAFPVQILEAVEAHFNDRLDLLEAAGTSTPTLVHHDLWPGNILVKDGIITGILDFEFATWAPREYELVLIEQFCLCPNDFVEEDFEVFASPDFAGYLSGLRAHYPALFDAPGLRQRMDLYHIEYVLSAYLNWIEHQAKMHAGLAVQPVAKVMNFLFEHGTRMFDH